MTESVDSIRRGYRFSMIPEWIMFHPTLTAADVRVFGVLDRFAGPQCFPSIATIAKKATMSESSVHRSIKHLVEAGAIAIEPRVGEDGRQSSNLYHLAADQQLTRGVIHDTPVTGGTLPGVTRDTRTRERKNESNTPAHSANERRQMDRNFDAFWEMYPRKVGKKAALRAFEKIDFAKEENYPAVIGLALGERCRWWEASATPMDKIPHAATWLNGERWNDVIEPVVRLVSGKLTTQERFEQAAEMIENMNGESIFDRMRRAGQNQPKAIGG